MDNLTWVVKHQAELQRAIESWKKSGSQKDLDKVYDAAIAVELGAVRLEQFASRAREVAELTQFLTPSERKERIQKLSNVEPSIVDNEWIKDAYQVSRTWINKQKMVKPITGTRPRRYFLADIIKHCGPPTTMPNSDRLEEDLECLRLLGGPARELLR